MIFKLRAECGYDVKQLQHLLAGQASAWHVVRVEVAPDIEVEFESILTVDALRRAASCVPDGHVMVETLAEASKYTGERTHGRSVEA